MDFVTPFWEWYRVTCWITGPLVLWSCRTDIHCAWQGNADHVSRVGVIVACVIGLFFSPIIVVHGFLHCEHK